MDKIRQEHFQRLVEQVRERQNSWNQRDKFYIAWPGKASGEPAFSMYPNIVAELNARRNYCLEQFASFANVSEAVMAAVLEDGEDLTLDEGMNLARNLNANPKYLFSHTLQLISPDSNKGKRRLVELITTADTLSDLDIPMDESIKTLIELERRTVDWISGNLQRGEPVSYAGYRIAMSEAIDIQKRRERALRRCLGRPRSKRLSN